MLEMLSVKGTGAVEVEQGSISPTGAPEEARAEESAGLALLLEREARRYERLRGTLEAVLGAEQTRRRAAWACGPAVRRAKARRGDFPREGG